MIERSLEYLKANNIHYQNIDINMQNMNNDLKALNRSRSIQIIITMLALKQAIVPHRVASMFMVTYLMTSAFEH